LARTLYTAHAAVTVYSKIPKQNPCMVLANTYNEFRFDAVSLLVITEQHRLDAMRAASKHGITIECVNTFSVKHLRHFSDKVTFPASGYWMWHTPTSLCN